MRMLFVLFLLWAHLCFGDSHKADLVIFSYDRPLQLYALLESVEKYTTNLGEVHIILRCSDDRFRKAYQEVFDTFSSVYVNEHQNRDDFKEVFLRVVSQTPHEYMLFGVDDIIMTDYVDFDFCVRVMQRFDAYAFQLRTGKNCTQGYPEPNPAPWPPFVFDDEGLCVWRLNQAEYYWGYPHTVDMSIFRKDEILKDLQQMNYSGPNTLEGYWMERAYKVSNRLCVCFERSRMVNIPMNCVQKEGPSINMGIDPSELLRIFNEGKKIDIAPFFRIDNKCAHMDAMPVFLAR